MQRGMAWRQALTNIGGMQIILKYFQFSNNLKTHKIRDREYCTFPMSEAR